ncbi:hypothetical protein [Kineococcus sp. SYSU DK002]
MSDHTTDEQDLKEAQERTCALDGGILGPDGKCDGGSDDECPGRR